MNSYSLMAQTLWENSTGGSRTRRESPRGRAKGCPPKRYLELGNKDW